MKEIYNYLKEVKFMNIQRFKNNEIRILVCGLLGKRENEIVYTEELNQIDRLNINPRIFKIPSLHVDLGDLYLFKNLKSLYIRDMYITDYHIQCLNQVPSLDYLQMNKCKMENVTIPLYLPKLEGLSLVSTYGIDMKFFKDLPNLKILKVINNAILKYKGLENLQSLQEIYFQNNERVDLKNLLKINNLKLLNLDGSTVKKEKYEIILRERIKVEHARQYLVA